MGTREFKFLMWFFALLIFMSCENLNNSMYEDEEDQEVNTEGTDDTVADADSENSGNHEESGDYTWSSSEEIGIALNGSSISVNGSGATANGSTLTISSAGTYKLSGTLSNGQIIVDSDDEELVRVILNGIDISNSSSAPIFIKDAEKVILVLAENTTNTLKDGFTYTDNSDDEPNATIFSKSNLTILGEGSLTVHGNYNDGIASKDGLIITSGTLNVTAKDDGIRGKDYLTIKNGKITINAGGDGLKSDNEDDSTLGFVNIETGDFSITSGGDAIAAQTDVIISKGNFNLTSGGGSSNSASSTTSSKGIKGAVSVVIDDGEFTISSADDGVHSNSTLSINNGVFEISSGDDGIHADEALGINCGEINIIKSYEGIESKVITISDGTIHLKASDDGLNAADGSDAGGMGGRPGQGFSTTSSNMYLYIKGGYIYVNATGDGIDINGSVEMSDGTLIVNGPTSNANGALDYDGSFKITGGFLLAVGSSGMAQATGTSSSQYSLLLNYGSTQQAGSLVTIKNSDGNTLFSFSPVKNYNSLAFSSAYLKNGTTYEVYSGGSNNGDNTDGLYLGGTYTGGTKYTSFTISSILTRITSR